MGTDWFYPARVAKRAFAPFLPTPIKRAAARGYGAWADLQVRSTLREIAQGSGPIIVGPWLSEVGFELLYWIPFVRWAVEQHGIDPERLVVVSRGGTRCWYGELGGGYVDAFELYSEAEFAEKNSDRAVETRGQKQMAITEFDLEILRRAAERANLQRYRYLHPSLMYNLLRPYWWALAPHSWVRARMSYRQLSPWSPGRADSSDVVTKFYFSGCLPRTDANVAYLDELLSRLRVGTVVRELVTGLKLDDHAEHSSPEFEQEQPLSASTNLGVQTSQIAAANRFVGTYGGFAYLAPFLGVDSFALFSDRQGFLETHLAMALDVFQRHDFGRLRLYDVRSVSPTQLAAEILASERQPSRDASVP